MADRPIVYPSELPRVEDFLGLAKSLIYAVGTLAEATIGSIYTGVAGLAISATDPASMNVIIGRGSIYELEPVDATAYGALGTDSNTLFKQGINPAPVTLPITAPSTSGYSQYYVIQATFNETDTNSIVPPYFNSANPLVPLSGPGGAGGYQNTLRQDQCVISTVAGTAAPTGSQTIPSPTLGAVPLYVILVSNATTSITSANWFTHPSAPFFPNLESLKSQFIPVVPATTFYVNASTGSDSNDGQSATTYGVDHGPFQTGQGAINYISQFFSATTVTINFAAGTYAGFNINPSLISGWNLSGANYLTTSISSPTIATNNGRAFIGYGSSPITIGGFTLTAYYECINANTGTLISASLTQPNAFVGVGSTSAGLTAYYGGAIIVATNQTISFSGTFGSAFLATNGGSMLVGYHDAVNSYTPTLAFGTTTFTSAVIQADSTGSFNLIYGYLNMTGSPTGQRYICLGSGGINASGSGSYTWIPGTIAGNPNTGSVNGTGGWYQI